MAVAQEEAVAERTPEGHPKVAAAGVGIVGVVVGVVGVVDRSSRTFAAQTTFGSGVVIAVLAWPLAQTMFGALEAKSGLVSARIATGCTSAVRRCWLVVGWYNLDSFLDWAAVNVASGIGPGNLSGGIEDLDQVGIAVLEWFSSPGKKPLRQVVVLPWSGPSTCVPSVRATGRAPFPPDYLCWQTALVRFG